VSQKIPPADLLPLAAIFPKRLGILQPNFTCPLRIPIYARLRILSATLTKLCHIKRDHPVHIMCAKCPPPAETHAGIVWHFIRTVMNFIPNFTRLLNVHMYARMQIFIQLSPTVTKLCHTVLSATPQRAFRSMVDILSTLWWLRLLWHNFVKVAVNWIKICSPA